MLYGVGGTVLHGLVKSYVVELLILIRNLNMSE